MIEVCRYQGSTKLPFVTLVMRSSMHLCITSHSSLVVVASNSGTVWVEVAGSTKRVLVVVTRFAAVCQRKT